MQFEPDVMSAHRVHTVFLWAASLVCLLMLPQPADAQTLTLGVEGGVNFTNVTDYSAETGGRTGLIAGGFLGIELSRIWTLQPEILYAQKGTSTENRALDLAYLEIPILVKALIPVGGNTIRPVVYAGPTFAFQISCSEKWKIDIGFPTSDECDPEYSHSDFENNRSWVINESLKDRALSILLGYGLHL